MSWARTVGDTSPAESTGAVLCASWYLIVAMLGMEEVMGVEDIVKLSSEESEGEEGGGGVELGEESGVGVEVRRV